jgi:hypothetical protein
MNAVLEALIGQVVVIDFRSTFVCIGKLVRLDEHHLELRNADLHDLRDTQTTRENYVVESHLTGVKRNRKRVFIPRAEIVAISALEDVVES